MSKIVGGEDLVILRNKSDGTIRSSHIAERIDKKEDKEKKQK